MSISERNIFSIILRVGGRRMPRDCGANVDLTTTTTKTTTITILQLVVVGNDASSYVILTDA